MPTWETLPGALSHHSPCSEKLHWESGEIARLGRMEDGRREKGAICPRGRGTMAVSPPRRIRIFINQGEKQRSL